MYYAARKVEHEPLTAELTADDVFATYFIPRKKQITRISEKKSPRTSWLKTEFPKYQNHHAWRADAPTNQSPTLIFDFLKTVFFQPDKMGP